MNRHTPYTVKSTKSSSKKPPPTKPKPILARDPIEVYCRLRPPKNFSGIPCLVRHDDTTVHLKPPSNGKSDLFYNFKYVFDENCEQKFIFENVAYPLLKDLLFGKNGLLFTYGVTSSGKTYTIAGTPENTGLLPRCLDVIFNSIENNLSRKCVFKMTSEHQFEVRSSEDALLEWQKQRSATVSAPRTPSLKRQKRDQTFKVWENRMRETMNIDLTKNDHAFAVFVSYFQIYNNYIYDLLDENFEDNIRSRNQEPRPKYLRENNKRHVFVVSGTEVEVCSSQEAFDQFLKGVQRLRVAQTALNAESSRSHSVFNIRIVQAPRNADNEVNMDENLITVSQLSLVDLAGSERTGRTQTTGERLKEASSINNSLMALRNCIDVLRDNQKLGQKKLVPYRDNKLTHLFKGFFEGEGKVRMIICVHPDAEDFDETLHVMKFAETTSEVVVTRSREDIFRYVKPLPVTNDLPIPPTALLDPSDATFFPSWISYIKSLPLQTRNLQVIENHKNFRRNLAEMESEYVYIKQGTSVLKRDLDIRENQIKSLENKIMQTESLAENYRNKYEHSERKCSELEKNIRGLKQYADTFETEKEQLRQQAKDKIKHHKENMRNAFEQMIANVERQLEREKGLNKEKINLMREILNADVNNFELLRDVLPSASTPVATNTQAKVPVSEKLVSPSKRKSHNETSTFRTTGEENECDRNAAPTVNPRHRRSLSTGNEKWIDHRPKSTLDLGTVLQPMIKNKISVTNLKSFGAENIKECSNYALTHHVADKQGDVETQVYKGEVIPSVSGGAQVIFQDIETLKQNSPPGRKRNNNEMNTEIETGVLVQSNITASASKKRSRR